MKIPNTSNPLRYAGARRPSQRQQYKYNGKYSQPLTTQATNANKNVMKIFKNGCFYSINSELHDPGRRIHPILPAWLAGSEQPRRLRDEKYPHFFGRLNFSQGKMFRLQTLHMLHAYERWEKHQPCNFILLKGRGPLNWPIYGVLSQFYTCLNMRVFAGSEPP